MGLFQKIGQAVEFVESYPEKSKHAIREALDALEFPHLLTLKLVPRQKRHGEKTVNVFNEHGALILSATGGGRWNERTASAESVDGTVSFHMRSYPDGDNVRTRYSFQGSAGKHQLDYDLCNMNLSRAMKNLRTPFRVVMVFEPLGWDMYFDRKDISLMVQKYTVADGNKKIMTLLRASAPAGEKYSSCVYVSYGSYEHLIPGMLLGLTLIGLVDD